MRLRQAFLYLTKGSFKLCKISVLFIFSIYLRTKYKTKTKILQVWNCSVVS